MAEKASAVFHNCLVSAPGKVILSGEHAVVYNKTAIATSVDLRCYVLLMVSQSGQVKLDLPDMDLTQTWDVTHITDLLHSTEDQQLQDLKTFCGISEAMPSMQELACLILLYLLVNIASDKLCDLPGLDITISSQLPFGAGLGSSAAYSASLSAAMLIGCGLMQPPNESHSLDMMDRIPEHFKRMMVADDLLLTDSGCHGKHCDMSPEELKMINRWAYNCERLVHGTPSGIDNTISIHGGAIKFNSGNFTQLKKMPNVKILLVHTKVQRSTKKLVAAVKDYHTKYPQIIQPIFESIEEIALKFETLFGDLNQMTKQTYSLLKELTDINHHLLNAIGVGHPSLDKIHHIASEMNMGCKLTGAGGGGCALIMIPPDVSGDSLAEIEQRITSEGFECWQTTIGTNGITCHCLS